MLAAQALLFILPYLVWRHCIINYKMNVEELILSIRNSKDIYLNVVNIKDFMNNKKVIYVVNITFFNNFYSAVFMF